MSDQRLIIVTWGGIGDALICSPVFKALKERYPDRKIILYCPRRSHIEVYRNNPYIDSVRLLKIWAMIRYPYHLFAYLFNENLIKFIELQFQHVPLTWVYDKSVKDIVADIFRIKLTDRRVQLFFSRDEQRRAAERMAHYRNVIFMHIISRTSQNHHWELGKWVELVKQMPDFTFIQLGYKDEPYVGGAIDWRGKTTLRESLCLLQHGDSFVGVDSSFAHATNAFNLPGVVLFGDSTPVIWGHQNNINIYKEVACSPCFYYLWADRCPYGHECMSRISVEEVKAALLRQIEGRKKVSTRMHQYIPSVSR